MPFLQDHFSQLRHAIQSLGKRREMFTEGFEVHFTLSESLFHAKARRREESKRVIAGPFAPSRLRVRPLLSESLFHAKARRREESKRVIAGPFATSRLRVRPLPSNPQRHSTRAISRP